MKNPYNWIAKNKIKWNVSVKKGAEDLNRYFSKEAYRWQTGTWKDAQHH